MNDQLSFDFIDAMLEDAETKARNERDHHNLHSCRTCWPDWEGPKVYDGLPGWEGIDGWCSVGQCCVHSVTHNDTRYHYCAPCKILEVHPEFLKVEVCYDDDSHCVHYNGEILLLELWEMWPPVDRILRTRREFGDRP